MVEQHGPKYVNWELERHAMPEEIKSDPSQPDEEWQIEHVYGYRTSDCQQNLRYNNKGDAVYMIAALGVVMETETCRQKFYGGKEVETTSKSEGDDTKFHRDDIISLDISVDRELVVTGQTGKSPSVHVWNSTTTEQVAQFALPQGSRGVAGVSISPCKRYVACVDLHNDHRVTIYNIQREKQLLHIEGSKERIFDIAWSKRPDDFRFVTVSLKEIKFWHPADVTKRLSQKGTFGKNAAMTNLNCVAFDNEGWCYTGGENGHIQVWSDACSAVKSIKAHVGGVTGLVHTDGKLISAGNAKDKRIAIISAQGGNFKLDKFIDVSASFPRSIDLSEGNLLVGLRNGSIVEYKDILTADEPVDKILMQSHFEGETWGLDVTDDGKHVITSGDDNKFILYDIEERRFERSGKISDHKPKNAAKAKSTASSQSVYPANQQARAIIFSPKHKHIAIVNNMGKISIRDFNDFDKKIATLKNEEWSEMARYSPCENYLAVASHDNNLYVYKISEDGKYELHKNFAKHSSYIQALDWTSDSEYIRTSSGDYEKLYFDIKNKIQDTAGLTNLKDREWDTVSVKLGWDVQGVHPVDEDGTHINYVNANHDKSLLVSCDDYGLVNFYRYPVLDTTHKPRSYAGHSEHVLRAEFSPDGSKLFTVGGQDKALIQWHRK